MNDTHFVVDATDLTALLIAVLNDVGYTQINEFAQMNGHSIHAQTNSQTEG